MKLTGSNTSGLVKYFGSYEIPIAFISPLTGDLRPVPLLPLFYGSIGGIIVIIFYSSYKDKKERCFIIGTGTSLNELDLSLLKDEVTISINLILHILLDSF